jgi:hypothetical protein
MKQSNATKVYYEDPSRRDEDGSPKRVISSEAAFNAGVKKATEESKSVPTLISSQTFTYKEAETVGQALALSGVTADVSAIDEYLRDNQINVDIFLSVFGYGADLRQHNEAADQLRSDNFVAKEGAVDLGYAVATKQERSKMTPEEKAAKTLGITAEQLSAALKLVMAQASAS